MTALTDGFPAPLTERLNALQHVLIAAAAECERLAYKVEDLEAIEAGASHPLGCFDTQDGWYAHPECKLDHDGDIYGWSVTT